MAKSKLEIKFRAGTMFDENILRTDIITKTTVAAKKNAAKHVCQNGLLPSLQ
jgi:hypothetical protein